MQPAHDLAARIRMREETIALLPLFEEEVDALHLHSAFAWVEPLTEEERLQMKRELANALSSALSTRDWTEYDDTLYGWQETARILRDQALTVALLEGRDPDQEVRLRRP